MRKWTLLQLSYSKLLFCLLYDSCFIWSVIQYAYYSLFRYVVNPATTFPAQKFLLEWGRKDHHFFIFPAPTFPAHTNNCQKKLLSAILVLKKHKSNKWSNQMWKWNNKRNAILWWRIVKKTITTVYIQQYWKQNNIIIHVHKFRHIFLTV